MTPQEKELISGYVAGNQSREEFLRSYPVDLVDNDKYILSVIEDAHKNSNAEEVDYALSLLTFDNDFTSSDKYVEVLSKLLAEGWHHRHEDIVSLLQGIRSPLSIDVLYKTALKSFDYLSYDDTYSLARKCIHALGDINTDEAREKLRLLAASNIPIIKEKAEKQLHYYSR